MIRPLRLALLLASIAGLTPVGDVAAQAATSVVLQWRNLSLKCVEPERLDYSATLSVSMFEAVNAIQGGYASFTPRFTAPAGASAEAAVAQAAHDALALACPRQQGIFAAALTASLARVADSTARARGVLVGRRAAAAVIAARVGSRGGVRDSLPVPTRAGEYMTTDTLVGTGWAQLRPWAMQRPEQFRVPAPPALTSETWGRDLEEIRRVGGTKSTERTAAQTETARFWGMLSVRTGVRQLLGLPGRRLVDDARFLALTDVAWTDSYVSLFEGKYHYRLWRPITAVRNADMDGNPATNPERDWMPLLTTPMHPEYPCGHCLSAAAVGTVIAMEFGDRMPSIVLDRSDAPVLRYTTAQAYIDDISESRLFAGAHPRFSMLEAKTAGAALGKFVVEKMFTRVAAPRAGAGPR